MMLSVFNLVRRQIFPPLLGPITFYFQIPSLMCMHAHGTKLTKVQQYTIMVPPITPLVMTYTASESLINMFSVFRILEYTRIILR